MVDGDVIDVITCRVVPVEQSSKGQIIERNVRTYSDGTLKDFSTGLDVAYLFWEAHTVSDLQVHMSPPPSPCLSQEYFVPNKASRLAPSNSGLRLISDVPQFGSPRGSPYLHHRFATFRRSAYERPAPLDVVPAPDVVTRVFILFKGVDASDIDTWSVSADVTFWCDVVDVDLEKALDARLFRISEWDGMEILY
ncbi:hypothetical protein MPER_03123 [Moniliophthora perniciosa FA553]|nr:hypothetical protein MPER_03123 [Moniliophthora perniciosa FA553]